ncbi:MAG: TlpA family protein disulfide reductase [Bacteroidales bacterium]|nr:TlpA family protein disulfide reductase [Bacteroidales bacterium]
MKKFALLLAVMFFTVSLVAQQKGKELALGSEMPQFSLNSSVYGDLNSADLKGKVVLVSMFATWCGPCQLELAEIEKELWPKYKDNAGFKLVVIGREHTDAQLADYNRKKGFTFPLYPDPKRGAYSKFAESTIPRAYLYDKEGKLVYSSIGYSKDEFAKLLKAIEEAL